jgi:hypothetical protein
MNLLEPQSEAMMPNIKHLLICLLAIALVYTGWFFYNQETKIEEETTNTNQATVEETTPDYTDVIVVEEFNNETPEEANESSKENITENQIIISDKIYQEEIPTENKEEPITETTTDTITTSNKIEIPSTGIFVEVLKTTWVEVKDKDKLFLSKVLQPGETYKVPEGEGKILSVGKHDGVNIYVNGVLTNIVRPQKKMNILLDKYINPEL